MTNTCIIFAGPTLSPDEIHAHVPQAQILPPVQCGDIIKAMHQYPECNCIAIIDGLFEQCASVWHKEILLALSNGITVYGASSMGALRAAELHSFGMIGIGDIFQAYASGDLEDDDEVAVLHENAELNYKALSDAMVNIRETLKKAEQENSLTNADAIKIIDAAKKCFYFDRQLTVIAKRLLSTDTYNTFADWLNNNFIDLKKLDAIKLLQTIKTNATATTETPAINLSLPLRKLNHLGFLSRFTGNMVFKREITDCLTLTTACLHSVLKENDTFLMKEPSDLCNILAHYQDQLSGQALTTYNELCCFCLSYCNKPNLQHTYREFVILLELNYETEQPIEEQFHETEDTAHRAFILFIVFWTTLKSHFERFNYTINPEQINKFSLDFRLAKKLLTTDEFNTWLSDNHLDLNSYQTLMANWALFKHMVVEARLDCFNTFCHYAPADALQELLTTVLR